MTLGCFGMPSVFSHSAEACRSCDDAANCEKSAFSVLNAISASIKVDDMLRSYRLARAGVEVAETLTPDQERRVAKAPVKVAGRLRSLFASGFDITAARKLAAGENPFPETGAKHLHLAGELLLKRQLTRTSLRRACQERLGWSEGTAFSQVSQAVALLTLLGLVQEQDEMILVTP